jgi:hypothetical protein
MPLQLRPYIYAALTILCGAIATAGWWAGLSLLVDPGEFNEGLVISALLSALVVVVTIFFFLGCWLTWEVWREERYDRREREGRCCRCGYDLRASAGNVCSECGFPIVLRSASRTQTNHQEHQDI